MRTRLTSLVAVYGFAIVAVIFGLGFTNGNAALEIGDPGFLVRWAEPIVQAVKNLAMAMTVGSLVFGAWSLASGEALNRMLKRVSITATVWTITGLLHFLLTFLWISGTPFSLSNTFGAGLYQFATQIELGQALMLNLIAALLISFFAVMASGLRSTLFLATFALAALVPIALTGHASGTAGHDLAVNSMGIHLVAATIWVGGLIELGFNLRGDNWVVLAKRYSTLAVFAFALTALSGIAAAALRIVSPKYLFTLWGDLVLVKVVLLLALGVAGAYFRLKLLKGENPSKQRFAALAAVELALMGAAFGIGASLSKSPTPSSQINLPVDTSPAAMLTGQALPPELTMVRWFTSYRIDLIWFTIAMVGIALYLFGVWRLHRRGDKWPIGRTLSWVSGMLLLAWITCGPLNVYEQYLFSIHMLAHMILTMGVPVFLVPGAPITLLLRASEVRHDESRGLREWALWAVHTPWARLVSNPIFAAVNFAASLLIFYFTPLFGWATRDHLGHEWMIVHFLITGYLFVQALVSIDPGPAKVPYLLRIMLLIGTLAFHAFFGLALMSGNSLLLPEWFGAMGRTWGQNPLDDQQTGGAIAWGIGEMPAAVLTLIVSIQWFRSDSREAKRMDRASDRSGNKDVEDYNQMLARLAERDGENR